jgi:hypothetical protein
MRQPSFRVIFPIELEIKYARDIARAYFDDISFRELARVFSLFVFVVPSQDSVFVSTLAIPFIRNIVGLISKICLLAFSWE